MTAAGSWDADFPVARCARCDRDVLTHVAMDAAGDERRRCIHCDAELDPAEIRAGFALTDFFLRQHLFEPRGEAAPRERDRMVALATADVPLVE